jgi:beta-barrel assembly-enhancing protease
MVAARPALTAMGALRKSLLALLALPALAAADAGSDVVALQALRQLDARVADVGYRLARGGADLCADRVPLSGIVPHHLAQYDEDFRDAAVSAFGLGAGPSVLVVASGSPAASAGIRADDRLVSIDGRAFPAGAPSGKSVSYEAAEQAIVMLERAFADGSAELVLSSGEQVRTAHVDAETGCPSRFQVDPSRSLQGSADGTYVEVSSGLVAFAETDDELAALLAHELAHNILDHRVRLDQAGVKRGLLKYFGRNARLIRATEVEADQLSIYLLDRAGYSPDAAAQFWKRFGPRSQGLLGTMATHPNWKARVRSLQAESERLARMKANGERPLPRFLIERAAISSR